MVSKSKYKYQGIHNDTLGRYTLVDEIKFPGKPAEQMLHIEILAYYGVKVMDTLELEPGIYSSSEVMLKGDKVRELLGYYKLRQEYSIKEVCSSCDICVDLVKHITHDYSSGKLLCDTCESRPPVTKTECFLCNTRLNENHHNFYKLGNSCEYCNKYITHSSMNKEVDQRAFNKRYKRINNNKEYESTNIKKEY